MVVGKQVSNVIVCVPKPQEKDTDIKKTNHFTLGSEASALDALDAETGASRHCF